MTLYTKSHDDIARFFVTEPDAETFVVPEQLETFVDAGRLRILDDVVVDIETLPGPFFVSPDDVSLKHVAPGPGRVAVDCAAGDKLALAADGSIVVEDAARLLAALKSRLRTMVDNAAERERLKYITAGVGQAMTYLRKLEEARAADSETDPQAEDYPLLAASVGIDAPDIGSVANLVLAMDQQWTMIGAAIETARLGGKKAIADAVDEAAAREAFEAVQWPASG